MGKDVEMLRDKQPFSLTSTLHLKSVKAARPRIGRFEQLQVIKIIGTKIEKPQTISPKLPREIAHNLRFKESSMIESKTDDGGMSHKIDKLTCCQTPTRRGSHQTP